VNPHDRIEWLEGRLDLGDRIDWLRGKVDLYDLFIKLHWLKHGLLDFVGGGVFHLLDPIGDGIFDGEGAAPAAATTAGSSMSAARPTT
jgi:hypothetical protein